MLYRLTFLAALFPLSVSAAGFEFSDTDSVDLFVSEDVLSADVIIDPDTSNLATVGPNGLMVTGDGAGTDDQAITRTGDVITLEDGGSVDLSDLRSPVDPDTDETNELGVIDGVAGTYDPDGSGPAPAQSLPADTDAVLDVAVTNPANSVCDGYSAVVTSTESGTATSGLIEIPFATTAVEGLQTINRETISRIRGAETQVLSDLKSVPADTTIYGPIGQATFTNPDPCRPMRLFFIADHNGKLEAHNGPSFSVYQQMLLDVGGGAGLVVFRDNIRIQLSHTYTDVNAGSQSHSDFLTFVRPGPVIPPGATVTIQAQYAYSVLQRHWDAIQLNSGPVTLEGTVSLFAFGRSM